MTKRKILVLSNNNGVVRSLVNDLKNEYMIRLVESEENALKMIASAEIDLVILNIDIDNTNSLKLLKAIKRVDSSILVIVFSSYPSKELIIEALRLHADDYVEKPFDIYEIRERIYKLLGKQERQSQNTVSLRIQKIKDFIEENCERTISLKDIAKIIYLRPKYISALFKRSTGKTFSEYKMEVKVRMAKRLLENTGYSAEEIAFRLGYQNHSSFRRMFKKITKYSRNPLV